MYVFVIKFKVRTRLGEIEVKIARWFLNFFRKILQHQEAMLMLAEDEKKKLAEEESHKFLLMFDDRQPVIYCKNFVHALQAK